jgi:NADH-quinone oxidoreductase subunit N
MVSFYNLVMLFIGIEIMSVSLYILAGIKKSDFASNEAALKYFPDGRFSTGFLLFGMALIIRFIRFIQYRSYP